MKRLFTFLVCALVCVLSTHAWNKQSVDIKVDGLTRNMVVFTPDVSNANMPLMIVTHGRGQSPEYQYENDKYYELIDTAKFVVTYLRSIDGNWDCWGGTKDLNFVLQTIDEMKSRYNIDTNRVYWSGFSMGSMLMYSCMDKVQDKIVAFGPMSGIMQGAQPWNNCKKPVNLCHCHGTGDGTFEYEEFGIYSYVENMANILNKSTKHEIKATNVSNSWYGGTREVWSGGPDGGEVELFTNAGGHWPDFIEAREIWNFCKRFSFMTYEKAYQQIETLVYEWKDTPEVTSSSIYTNAQKSLTTYGPDNVTTDTRKATALKKLTQLITMFENLVKDKTKVEVYNNGETDQPDGFDPNFHIYLCFGQSNMEGNAVAEAKDKSYVDPRFMMMACVNQTNANRTKGKWYTAYPPLCREMSFGVNLTPADYFGREMVANLPKNIKVGILNVAVGGCAIELFDEEKCADQIKNADQWFKNYCAAYNNNPYKVLVTMAKKAQKNGVIKGILLHQGCSNNGQPDWPVKVKRVYIRLLNDLGLNEEEVPLLIGETLRGGYCEGHNAVIAKTASVIPNSYVISSEGCPGADDHLHFTAEGYRIIGKRYAQQMLQILDQKKEIDFDTSETFFPLAGNEFNPSLYLQGTYTPSPSATRAANAFKTTESYNETRGFGGWRYTKGVDFSAHKYLVVAFTKKPSCHPTLRIYDTDDYLNPCYTYSFPTSVTANQLVKIPLDEMQTEDGKKIDPSHIYMVGFETDANNVLYIKELYLSDDEELTPTEIESLPEVEEAEDIYLDLQGRPVENPTNGIYIRRSDGKKVLAK